MLSCLILGSRITASRRSPKKMKRSNNNDSDYDTEPLPEKSTETKSELTS